MKKSTIIKAINYSLLIVSILMIVTGYGITKHRIVEKITFGILQKSEAFKLHSDLTIVFILLIIAHIGIYKIRFKK